MPSQHPGASRPGQEQGERIGGFRLLRRLGAGGMGVVHAAWDERLQREVALKVLAPHLSADEEFRRRFEREARTQAGLDSAHVLPVHATGEDDGRLWIATTLVRDGDLGALLAERGPMPVPVALDLVDQVADGLADAHAAGLVHRDVKPENVLVRRRGEELHAYVADFGVARPTDVRFTRTGVLVGSPTWMAPELHRGEPAGVASDVYATGLLLWTLLTGSPPWSGSDYEVARGHVEGAVPRLSGSGAVVEGLNRVLARTLAKDPGDRYADVPALRADLRRLVAGSRAAPVGPAAPSRPTEVGGAAGAAARQPVTGTAPARRGRAVAVAAGVAVAAVLAGLVGWALWPSADEPTERVEGSSASEDVEPSPGPGATVEGEDPERRERAIDNLTVAFSEEMSDEDARCTAEAWVDDVGVDRLVENGALDDELEPTDTDVSEFDTDVQTSLTVAGFTCGYTDG